MKCEHCDKPATVHVTRVAQGKVHKVHLCEACAQKMGLGTSPSSTGSGPTVADALLGSGGGVSALSSHKLRRCPGCGLTLRGLQKEGRLGCAQCYEVFGEELDRILRSIHDATEHRGRTPGEGVKRQDLSRKMDVLQSRLTRAIEAEAFEDAAKIRDELQHLQIAMEADREASREVPGKKEVYPS
ncbi:MAG: UvrB/UvrC motif-containing protein [Verrucomicrobia bacterium]|nr:UvrB/UvrC motif-containing protein [Verrucomicrobiota bacterium]MCH8510303.1 UvrB/UvrC motif-containing protein [Kiritimatiellia bacterium]